MTYALPLLDEAKIVLTHMAPGMPPDFWWVTACILLILALTATVDAFTATIPEALIFIGIFAVVGLQGAYTTWDVAAQHLRLAIGAGALIWVINFAWYRKFGYDALGMGDAKWTMLAVACFGVMPVIFAWGLGAILASAFIGIMRLARYRVTKVTFAPFLFIGLCLGLFGARIGSF